MFRWLFTENWRSFNQPITKSKAWSTNGDSHHGLFREHMMCHFQRAQSKSNNVISLAPPSCEQWPKGSFHESWNQNSGVSKKICCEFTRLLQSVAQSHYHTLRGGGLKIHEWSLPGLSQIPFCVDTCLLTHSLTLSYLLTYFLTHLLACLLT